MPVFTKQLGNINYSNQQEALAAMANHIRYLQEQLEWQLSNLDSSNINEIDTSQTNISSSTGGTSIGGDSLTIKGKNGELFEVGIGSNGVLMFTLNGKDSTQMLYLDNDGKLVLTENTTVTIDGGDWDKEE